MERAGKKSDVWRKQEAFECEGQWHAEHRGACAEMMGRDVAFTEFLGIRMVLMEARREAWFPCDAISFSEKECSDARPASKSAMEFSRSNFLCERRCEM